MITIGIAQMRVVPGQPLINKNNMLSFIEKGNAAQLDFLIFPELALSGNLIGHLWEQPAFLKECERFGQAIAAESDRMAIAFGNIGLETAENGSVQGIFKALCLAHKGKLLNPRHSPYPFLVEKLESHRRFFDEKMIFQELKEELLTQGLFTIPFERETLHVTSFTSCREKLPSTKEGLDAQADLYLQLYSQPFTLDKEVIDSSHFSTLKETLPLLSVSAIGMQNTGSNFCIYDGQSKVTQGSKIVAKAASYEEDLLIIAFDPKTGKLSPKMSHSLQEETLTSSEEKLRSSASASMDVNSKAYTLPPSETEPTIAKVYRHLHYGLKEILSTLGISKVVIGLSGGIDSSVNAALYGTVIPRENLYLVTMPSHFTSGLTKGIAERLASNLQAPFATYPIDPGLELTIEEMEKLTFRRGEEEFTLTLSTLTKENMQARDRSSRILSALAASVGGIFTCNGNKTELSIGYATLYGDLAGAIAATADLWKYQVYELAHYLNDVVYKKEIIPLESITIKPSAELSEAQDVTKGLGDPLQYDYHDHLLQAFIEANPLCTPEDIARAYDEGCLEELLQLKAPISSYFTSPEDFFADLERWWNLQSGFAIAKRIQAPPLIVVSSRAYGSDFSEAQMKPYFSSEYYRLKDKVLATTKS